MFLTEKSSPGFKESGCEGYIRISSPVRAFVNTSNSSASGIIVGPPSSSVISEMVVGGTPIEIIKFLRWKSLISTKRYRISATTIVDYATIVENTQTFQTLSGDFLDEGKSPCTVIVIPFQESINILPHQVHDEARMISLRTGMFEEVQHLDNVLCCWSSLD
jgi:hypothetical protein